MQSQTKNQKGWLAIDKKTDFIKKLQRQKSFYITAEEIKKISGREPRLMAKFDHSVNRPEIFRKHGISIFPVSGNAYRLVRFNSYISLEYTPSPVSLPASRLQSFESINASDISSEDKALIAAHLAGVFVHFLNEKELTLTAKGKFSTGVFDYSLTEGRRSTVIEVDNAGAELDAGFEGSRFYIVEAKLGKTEDFNVRQLYYPYRHWQSKVQKEVVPLFFTYSDNQFCLWEYMFKDDYNPLSAQCIRSAQYILDFTSDEVQGDPLGVERFIEQDPPGVPFPQADDFEKVINILELIYCGYRTKDSFADYFSFDKRQADYYFNAARYLKLVNIKDDECVLTHRGFKAVSSPRKQRHNLLAKSILSRKIFYTTAVMSKEGGSSTELKHNIITEMKKDPVLGGMSDGVIRRRARTVLSWALWVVNVINELSNSSVTGR
jgi:hypothetical protein